MLSVFLLALISISGSAPCCRVEGVVRSEAGALVADATVSLSAPDLKATLTTTTSGEGRYAFEDVKPGIWAELHVLVHGRPVAQSVTLVTQPVETINLTIYAAPTSAASIEDLKPMGGEAGELRGTVRAAEGTPLAGARVGLDAVGIETITDSAGRYSFGRVRAPLSVGVSAAANGFKSTTKQIAVSAGGAADADFALSPAAANAEEEPLGIAEVPRDRDSLMLRSLELSAVPGMGPFDVFRAVDLLPVSAVGDDSELAINGMPPGDTLVTIDGIPWFAPSRLAGRIGAPLNTAFVQEAVLDAGRLGLSGRALNQGRPGGDAEVDFFGVSGSASVPLAHAGSVSIGARHSLSSSLYGDLLDASAGPDQHYVRDRVPALPGATPIQTRPLLSDLNGRLDLAPGHGNRVTASLYHGRDDGNFSRDVAAGPSDSIAVPPQLSLPADAAVQIGDAQTWKGQGGSAEWSRQWTPAISTDASVAQSRFTTARQRSFALTSPTTGVNYNLAAGLGGSSGTNEANDIRDTDVRATASVAPGFDHAVQAGLEYSTIDSNYAAQTEALAPNPLTGAPASQLITLMTRQETGHVSTIFAQDVWTPTGTLTVTPGARLVRDDLAAAPYVDPRVSASYVPGPGFVVKAAWSVDHQPAPRVTREDRQHGDMDFWTLADGTAIPIPRYREASGEGTYERAGVLIDAKYYYRWLDNLSLFAPRLLPGAAPAGAGLYVGTGSSTGFEFLAQNTWRRNSIWTALTIARAEYSFPGLESATFLASFDRREQVRAADSFRVWRGFSATAVMAAGTGAPYTSATTSEPVWFPNGAVGYQPRFDAKNGARLPAYQRLDVSGQYQLHVGAAAASAGVTVFNVYDAKNIAYYDYEVAGATLVTTETYLMRRTINAFVRVRF